jgi:8-oxo-dGDP phosphatase
MTKWRTISSEEVYATPWISVRRDEVRNHLGKPMTYSVVELQSPSVFILAVDAKNRILLQHHYRYTIDQMVWSLPAGHSDGQNLLEAAKRELAEEAGFVSDDWTQLGTMYQAIGIGKLPASFFLARNITPVKSKRDEDEQILEHRFVGSEELDAMVREGVFQETTILAAIYLAKARGLLT